MEATPMTRISRGNRAAACFVCYVTLFLATAGGWAELQPGRQAPPIKEKNVEGQMISSSQFHGGAAMLDFWVTWAKPCAEAMPEWQKLNLKYGSKGLVVVGICMDEDPRPVRPYLKQKGITYENLLDAQGKIAEAYKVREQPTTYLIDRHGIIRYVYPGYKSGLEKIVEQNIQSLLREK